MALRRPDHCGREEPHAPHVASLRGPHCDGDPATLARQLQREANPPPGPPSPPKPDWWGKRPYATWDESVSAGRVTDDPDGFPDKAIVELVEHLRRLGVVTLQSCAGHPGVSDGVLWVDARSVTAESFLRPPRGPFTYISRVWHPEDRWEIGWLPENLDAAVEALAALDPAEPRLPAHPARRAYARSRGVAGDQPKGSNP